MRAVRETVRQGRGARRTRRLATTTQYCDNAWCQRFTGPERWLATAGPLRELQADMGADRTVWLLVFPMMLLAASATAAPETSSNVVTVNVTVVRPCPVGVGLAPLARDHSLRPTCQAGVARILLAERFATPVGERAEAPSGEPVTSPRGTATPARC